LMFGAPLRDTATAGVPDLYILSCVELCRTRSPDPDAAGSASHRRLRRHDMAFQPSWCRRRFGQCPSCRRGGRSRRPPSSRRLRSAGRST
jgi:hypothetical protein